MLLQKICKYVYKSKSILVKYNLEKLDENLCLLNDFILRKGEVGMLTSASLMPGISSTAPGLVMHIRYEKELGKIYSSIGQRQSNAIKIYGNEVSKLFKIRDIASLSKTVNSHVGQLVDMVA